MITLNNMDLNTLVGLISNVGFPIVAFILMYRQANTSIKDNTKAITELTTYIKIKNGDK